MPDPTLTEPATGEDAPYAMWVHLVALDGKADEIESRMREAGRIIRAEPGNVEFILMRDRDDKNSVYVYESYRNLEAYQTHQDALAQIEAIADLGDFLAQEYTVTFVRHVDW